MTKIRVVTTKSERADLRAIWTKPDKTVSPKRQAMAMHGAKSRSIGTPPIGAGNGVGAKDMLKKETSQRSLSQKALEDTEDVKERKSRTRAFACSSPHAFNARTLGTAQRHCHVMNQFPPFYCMLVSEAGQMSWVARTAANLNDKWPMRSLCLGVRSTRQPHVVRNMTARIHRSVPGRQSRSTFGNEMILRTYISMAIG